MRRPATLAGIASGMQREVLASHAGKRRTMGNRLIPADASHL